MMSFAVLSLVGCTGAVAEPQRPAEDRGEPTRPEDGEAGPEDAPAPGLAIPDDGLAAVPLHEGRVLLSTTASFDWAAAPISEAKRIDYHEVWTFEVGVDVDALPAGLRTALTGAFDVYGAAGKLCTVTLEQPVIAGYVLPEDNDAALDGEQLQRLVEGPGEDDTVLLSLVADFNADSSCAGALWAREARLPPPQILVPAEIGDEESSQITSERARILDSKQGRELARQYRVHAEDDPSALPWSSYSEGKGQIWTDARGQAQLIVVAFGEGMSVPCFPVPDYVSARPVGAEPSSPWPWALWGLPTPSAVFDADLDGRYEMLFLRPFGSLVDIELVSETLRVELSLPDGSFYNC